MSSSHVCFFCFIILLMIISSNHAKQHSSGASKLILSSLYGEKNQSSTVELEQANSNSNPNPRNRKLLEHGSCSSRDISISQSKDTAIGIPQYIVQIVNTCMCAPSNIHLHCGWFASARTISPMTFKRLSYDDCLVNGGKPLKTSQIIRFSYSNSFMYPLGFRSAKFC
ncbi:hypothetical protein UlMin_009681 [Ulmus minor]